MGDLAAIQLSAAAGLLAAVILWISLARLLRRRGLAGWRAAPLGLALARTAAAYGFYWTAFFSSPALAVKMHALRLILAHALGAGLPWLPAGWLVLATLPLLPLARR